MAQLLERIGVALPIVQAGMGGGVSGPELAAAVSGVGGLGTLCLADPEVLAAQLRTVRELTDAPVAVNLLLPFTRPGHWRAASAADVVVTFWGAPRRGTSGVWIHQAGAVDEARAAHAAGADAVILQGVEAGGHVRGTVPALELLDRARAALPPGFPLLLAGGIADAGDVTEALDAGAEAVVVGTRFLMSQESRACDGYKRRLTSSTTTVLTELFGMGWPAPHRVLTNAATERWLRDDPRGPVAVRRVHRLTRPLLSRASAGVQAWMVRHQAAGVPFFGPNPPVGDVSDDVLDATALYAGTCVARIHDIAPAATIVADLTGARGTG